MKKEEEIEYITHEVYRVLDDQENIESVAENIYAWFRGVRTDGTCQG